MSSKKLCGLTLPEDISDAIKDMAVREHRSIANVIAIIVIDYVNNHKIKED